jgi:hypothetical protein
MATHDVPGKNPSNHDELDVGCWAEHDDGSLLLVEGIETGKVIYSIFDMSAEPPIEFRDAMPEDGFKDYFSFDDNDDATEKWLWHDKTSFPWDKVMQHFKAGYKPTSGLDQISAAQRTAERMGLKGRNLHKSDVSDKVDLSEQVGRAGHIIIGKIQEAIKELGI